MKALMAIDDAMKAALVKIHGVAEEDELPDSIQDIEFDRDGSLSERHKAPHRAVMTQLLSCAPLGQVRWRANALSVCNMNE